MATLSPAQQLDEATLSPAQRLHAATQMIMGPFDPEHLVLINEQENRSIQDVDSILATISNFPPSMMARKLHEMYPDVSEDDAVQAIATAIMCDEDGDPREPPIMHDLPKRSRLVLTN